MTQRVACDLPAGPEGSATSRGQRSSRDSTALPRTHRTWPATSLAVLPPLLFALLIPATVAHHGWSGQTELVDPNSGFVVCRQFSGSDYGGGSVSQCIGRCAGGSYTGYGRRALGRRSPSDPGTHPPHLAPRQLPEGYRCLAGHSCIRSPSEKCKWLVVSTLSHSSGPGIEVSDSTGCRGPRRGECTLYGDPFCTEPINNPPGLLTDGDAVSCTGLAGNWTGWCLDAYRYLNDRKVTGCPPVDAVFDPGPPWFGNWTCVRSCADKGNYVSVRRVHTTVACMGPFSGGPACSWYSDANCTELAPGEPEPQPESPGFRYSGGITCAQTTEGWCGAAADVVIRNLTGPACNNTAVNGTSPGAFGEWICVRSCPDKANYVKVRSVGKDVMCLGTVGTYNASTKTYQGNACSWFMESECYDLAPGEPAPEYGDGVVTGGYTCTQTSAGWCKTAADAIAAGVGLWDPDCGIRPSTTTADVVPTGSLVPPPSTWLPPGPFPTTRSAPSGAKRAADPRALAALGSVIALCAIVVV